MSVNHELVIFTLLISPPVWGIEWVEHLLCHITISLAFDTVEPHALFQTISAPHLDCTARHFTSALQLGTARRQSFPELHPDTPSRQFTTTAPILSTNGGSSRSLQLRLSHPRRHITLQDQNLLLAWPTWSVAPSAISLKPGVMYSSSHNPHL